MLAITEAATTFAAPSANTPAFGTPAVVTSPTAYTPGNLVSSVLELTGTKPSSVMPLSITTSGARCLGTPRKRSYASSLPSSSTATLRAESTELTRRPGTNVMSRSAKAASSAREVSGDGGAG